MAKLLTPQPAQPASTHQAIILFDSSCLLCNRSVQWIIRHDTRKVFKFAPLKSPLGVHLLQSAQNSLSQNDRTLIDQGSTMVLLTHNRALTRSDAALTIAKSLPSIYPFLATLAMIVPEVLRDWVYTQIAARRYRWFGKTDQCLIAESDRLISALPPIPSTHIPTRP
jgi:predicted DCC family thiol-disulfide oxidoreductase YuxK